MMHPQQTIHVKCLAFALLFSIHFFQECPIHLIGNWSSKGVMVHDGSQQHTNNTNKQAKKKCHNIPRSKEMMPQTFI